MEIWHRVTFNFNASSKKEFRKVVEDPDIRKKTLQSPSGGGLLVFVDIAETDPKWPDISDLIDSFGAADIQETLFTASEIRSARWLRMISVFEQGYPQPKMPWPFKQTDRELFCPKCAIYQQIAPMRIAKEPHLGKNAFVHTIWTNEIFCIPEVFQGLEEIQAKGYESWNVILHKPGQISEKIRQLYVPAIASPGFIAEEYLGRTRCSECGITKYNAHMRGTMRIMKEAIVPETDFMLTNEWFGSGYIAWREMLVSNRVAKLIQDKGWQGVRFKVVELV
jgi:hypothetical protein